MGRQEEWQEVRLFMKWWVVGRERLSVNWNLTGRVNWPSLSHRVGGVGRVWIFEMGVCMRVQPSLVTE